MIKITIELITTTVVPVSKQFLVESKVVLDKAGNPIRINDGYGDSKVQRDDKYEVREIQEERTARMTVLQQELPTHDPGWVRVNGHFDLNRVIAAINNLDLRELPQP